VQKWPYRGIDIAYDFVRARLKAQPLSTFLAKDTFYVRRYDSFLEEGDHMLIANAMKMFD